MTQHVHAIYEDGVLKPLEPLNLAEHERVWVSVAPTDADDTGADLSQRPVKDQDKEESFYEAATRLGFIGCFKGTPPDLSTNKKYMEGFGKRGA